MMIRTLKLKNFTVFKDLEIKFSPKLNLIIGANASGKTHILKAIYASLKGLEQASWDDEEKNSILQANRCITESLIGVFKPDDKLGKLKKIGSGRELQAEVSLQYLDRGSNSELDYSFNSNSKLLQLSERGYESHLEYSSIQKPIFIPAKEIISLLYEVYDSDLISHDLVNALTGPSRKDLQLHEKSKWILEKIENLLGGKFVFSSMDKIDFKLNSKEELPASLMAEGYKKIGILYRLLETGALVPGSSGTLLWDEPENNLNPQLLKLIAEILIELARNGQQIIIATHDYVLLKWFDILVDEKKGDEIKFHSLYNDSGDIKVDSQDAFAKLSKNLITDTFVELYEADIEKALG